MQVGYETAKSFLESFLDSAKSALESRHFIPVALPIVFKEDDIDICEPELLVFADGDWDEKIARLMDAGASAFFQGSEDIIVILDGCARKVEDQEEFMKNYDTERPSLYPKSMREDMLILTYIDLMDEDALIMICKYKDGDGGKLIFEEPVFLENKEMNSGVVQYIIHGYNLMYRHLKGNQEEHNCEECDNLDCKNREEDEKD